MSRSLPLPFLLLAFCCAAQTPDSLRTDTLRAVEISAARMSSSPNESALAISVLDCDRLHLAQAQLSLSESLGAVPGVFTMGDANFSQDIRIAIRGFGARAGFGIRGIKLLLDGIPESAPDGQAQVDNIDLAVIDRLELLRGAPAGLWGNASGGLISLHTDPVPAQPGHGFAEVRLTGGAFGYRQAHIKAGLRRGKVSAIASLTRYDLEGYREHSGAAGTLFNSKISWSPDSSAQWTLLLNATDSPRADDAGALSAGQAEQDPASANSTNVRFRAGESLRQGRAAIVFVKYWGDTQSLRLRGYAAGRDFENRLPFENGGQVAFQRFFAGGGGQYEWHTRRLHLSAGFDADRQADARQRFQNLDGVRGAQSLDQTEIFAGLGSFVAAEWNAAARLKLSGGLRYDAVLLQVRDHFAADGDQSGKTWYRRGSPWAGLFFRLLPHLHMYANAGTRFETPTLSELSNNPAGTGGFASGLLPQRTTAFEAGLRGQVNSSKAGRLGWEIACFRSYTRDELSPYELPGQPGRTYYRNAGEVLRQGLEISLDWHPLDGLSLLTQYTFSDFRFKRYTTPAGDVSGNRLPVLPQHLGQAELRWERPEGLYFLTTFRLTGNLYADDANAVPVDGWAFLKARIGWRRKFGIISVDLFTGADNLTDVRYFNNVRPNAGGGRYFEPGAGVAWLAGVRFRSSWQ
ncbi:MAG: TonB-dependent receptor [Saprospiraceae bacterium]